MKINEISMEAVVGSSKMKIRNFTDSWIKRNCKILKGNEIMENDNDCI